MLALSSAAMAAPIHSLTFQGVTFAIEMVDSDTLTLRIQNASSTPDPDWSPAVSIANFQFKNMGDFTGASVLAGPGTWTYGNFELASGACDGSKGKAKKVCMAASPVALTDDMTWTVDVSGGALDFGSTGPHLKVRFLDAGGKKQGSRLSLNLPLQVPEPSTVVLLIAGLGLLGPLTRRAR